MQSYRPKANQYNETCDVTLGWNSTLTKSCRNYQTLPNQSFLSRKAFSAVVCSSYRENIPSRWFSTLAEADSAFQVQGSHLGRLPKGSKVLRYRTRSLMWSGVIGRDRARPGCLEICLNGRGARPSARANITWAHRFYWFPGWGWLVCASQMLSSISHDMVSFSHSHMQTAIYHHYITLEWEKYDIINIIYFVYLFI